MSNQTVIANASVFDGESFIGSRDVIIKDATIKEIAVAGTCERRSVETDGGRYVDARGRTLTPGIIDCHVHVVNSNAGSLDAFAQPFSYPLYTAVDHLRRTLHGGVTTIRDAAGADAGLRLAVQNGIVEGPRIALAVSLMSQTGGHGDGFMLSRATMPILSEHPGRPSGVADGVEGVRQKAREILRAGADHIKVASTGGLLSPASDPRHSQFTLEEIRAIVEEAENQGKYVMAHAQGPRGIRNALVAGVRSIEHGIYLDEETIQLFLDRDAYLVPTLQAPRAVLEAADAGASLPPAVVNKARLVTAEHAKSVRAAYEAGVKIAMGTDAGVGAHGQNLQELELMEGVGMDTAAVLRAGTSSGAELMQLEDVGRLTVGAAADLVLFEGDLRTVGLSDARDRVEAVFQSGVQKR